MQYSSGCIRPRNVSIRREYVVCAPKLVTLSTFRDSIMASRKTLMPSAQDSAADVEEELESEEELEVYLAHYTHALRSRRVHKDKGP